MKTIVIEWPQLERKITARLYADRNTQLSDLLLEHLPYRVVQNHALVSGLHLYHTCPIVELIHARADYVVPDRTVCADGTVFLSHLVHLGVKYGPLTEYLPAAPVGEVLAEDLPILKEVGEAMWDAAYHSKLVVESHVYAEGTTASHGPYLRPMAPIANPEAQALMADIYDAVERISITPPEELLAIHEGRIASRAGSYSNYFTTMIFVNGEQRPLGYNALGGLLSACREPSTTLHMLQDLTAYFIKTPASFLEYCGLREQWQFVTRTLEVLPRLESKAEYYSLIATLYMYSGLLNCWNLHLFPWNADQGHFDYITDAHDNRGGHRALAAHV